MTNLRWFPSGSEDWPFGVSLLVATSSTYTQAGTIDQTSAIGSGDSSDYTSLLPLTVQAGTVLAPSATGVGSQDYVVTQLSIEERAEAGVTSNVEYTYRWTEA